MMLTVWGLRDGAAFLGCQWLLGGSDCTGPVARQPESKREQTQLFLAIKRHPNRERSTRCKSGDKMSPAARLHTGDSAVAFLHAEEWRLMVRMKTGNCMSAAHPDQHDLK